MVHFKGAPDGDYDTQISYSKELNEHRRACGFGLYVRSRWRLVFAWSARCHRQRVLKFCFLLMSTCLHASLWPPLPAHCTDNGQRYYDNHTQNTKKTIIQRICLGLRRRIRKVEQLKYNGILNSLTRRLFFLCLYVNYSKIYLRLFLYNCFVYYTFT